MSTSLKKSVRITGAKMLMTAFALLLPACGGGSGGGTPGTGSVYITDNLDDQYHQVILTIYRVELEKGPDQTRVTAFDDPAGTSYDVHELSGVLSRLPGSAVPPGQYDRVLITVGPELILVDNTGTRIDPNPHLDQNSWTTCADGKCVIEVAGEIQVSAGQRIVLDFDLKQFTYSAATHSVTAWVVLDPDGTHHRGYIEGDAADDFDLKGVVQAVNSDGLVVEVLKTEHFSPPTNLVTVRVSASTRFSCDDDARAMPCPIASLSDIQSGMTLEIRGAWNGTEFEAGRLELDEHHEFAAACDDIDRSIASFTALTVQPEIEGALSYRLDPSEASLNVGEMRILLTRETRIKLESGESEQVICPDRIPPAAGKIEIRSSEGRDASGGTVLLADRLEFKI